MRNPISLSLVATVLSAAAGAALLVPAPAHAATPTNAATSVLTLGLIFGHGNPKFATLTCDPTGGSHPQAQAACDEIIAADGDLDNLAGEPGSWACPLISRPVTATATGNWQGSEVRWSRTFTNTCWLAGRTGAVFDF